MEVILSPTAEYYVNMSDDFTLKVSLETFVTVITLYLTCYDHHYYRGCAGRRI